MEMLKTVHELRAWRRSRAGKVALVPTMGALHEGHLAHIDLALRHADDVVVSVFVNPTQFGPTEDFDRYPRDLDRDSEACESRGATAVFCPSVEQMYPPGVPEASVDVPRVSRELEGTHRPGHFPGVCRVVAKLLLMSMPDAATFGRKDFQQLRVVQAMIADLRMDVDVLEAPTVREADGLAMSSRNRYLSD
ncbi:MAG: pantoate--beta-alanine ligase, partial [Phycisphaeraceae bacterium]